MSTQYDEQVNVDFDNLAELENQEIAGSTDAEYVPPSEFTQPPPAVVYTFQRSDGDESPLKSGRSITKDGQYMAWFQFRAQIAGGEFSGRTVFASANTYVGKNRSGNSAADFIRAAGSGLRPTTLPEYEAAIGRAEITKIKKTNADLSTEEHTLEVPLAQLPGKVYSPFNAKTTWEWNDSDNNTFLRGYPTPRVPKKFQQANPQTKINVRFKDVGGKRVVDHVQVGPDGAEYGARLVITDYVVPKTGATIKTAAPTTTANLAPAKG